MAAVDYSLMELMTVIAAREVADGEVVFAGTGLPMLGVMLAQKTHAPRCNTSGLPGAWRLHSCCGGAAVRFCIAR